jgi:hypothetical protein
VADNLLTAVNDFVRERNPDAKMLQKQIADLGLPPVTMTTEQVREMGYENLDDFRRARIAQGQLADREFEREIQNYMGPVGASVVDASRYKTLFTTPKDQRGVYYWPSPDDETYKDTIERIRSSEKERKGVNKVFQENNMEGGEPDTVYGISVENANPRILAHEFRHRAGQNEKMTQFFDAWMSRTPEEWENSVTRHKDYAQVYEGAPSSLFSSYAEAEQDLLKKLQEARPEFLAAEVEALEEQHQARLASLDEKGIPYTINEERDREARERNLANRTDMADFRAKGRNKIKTYEISSIPLN